MPPLSAVISLLTVMCSWIPHYFKIWHLVLDTVPFLRYFSFLFFRKIAHFRPDSLKTLEYSGVL